MASLSRPELPAGLSAGASRSGTAHPGTAHPGTAHPAAAQSGPAQPGPAPSAGDEPAELLDLFSGDTIEAAMAAAVAALGPDVQVRRARKVRAGVRGLLGKDRYELLVTAAPLPPLPAYDGAGPGPGAPSRSATSPEAAVTDALDALLDAADAEESALGSGEHRPTPVDVDLTDLLAGVVELEPEPEPASRAVRTGAAAAPVVPTGWSRSALRRAGVPNAVLGRLPVEDPDDDLGWLAAIGRAIAVSVPPPVEPSPAHPAVVCGHGLAGALAILAAGVEGTPPWTLTVDGRTVPASPAELALVLRSAVLP